MPSRLNITEERVGDVTLLRLSGRLEVEEGDIVFREHINRLLADGRVKIVLDFQEVTRIDSAGIGMLVSKLLSARKRGGTIKLVHLTSRTDHLIDITRLDTVFEIYQDEAAAIRSFGVGT